MGRKDIRSITSSTVDESTAVSTAPSNTGFTIEKFKHQIYNFLKSYIVSKKIKIFVYFDNKNNISDTFVEVIKNKFEMAHDNQGPNKTEFEM